MKNSNSNSNLLPLCFSAKDKDTAPFKRSSFLVRLHQEMATDSIIPAWRIPWTGELGGLQPMGSQRVGHD